MLRLINLLAILLSPFWVLAQESNEPDFIVAAHGADITSFAPWIKFSDIQSVRTRAVSQLSLSLGVEIKETDNISLDRLYTSDLYQVVVNGKPYIINSDASYWISGDAVGNLFLFNGTVSPVNVSNKTRIEIAKIIQLASTWPSVHASFGEISAKETIFAFVDLACPHCKEFHLTKREYWQNRGFRFVYLPMTLNAESRKSRELHSRVFCIPDSQKKRDVITEIYLNGVKTEIPGLSDVVCSKVDQAMMSVLIGAGIKYNLTGTPLFVTETGNFFYGQGSLEQYLSSKSKN